MRRAFALAASSITLCTSLQAGDLLVTSWNTDAVLRFDELTGAPLGEFVASGSGGLDQPHSLHFGPDGNLYIAAFGGANVLRFDGQTGAFIDEFVPSGSGGLINPTNAVFGPDGHLYVSDLSIPGTLKFDGQTGSFIEVFVGPGNGLVGAESGIFGPDGHFYLPNGLGDNVLRYDGQTGAFMDVFASGGGILDPHEAIFGPNGNLYVSGELSNFVNEYDGQTGAFLRRFVNSRFGLRLPHGIHFARDGSFLVASFGRSRVNRYDGQSGRYIDTFVPPASGGLSGAVALASLPDLPEVMAYGCGVNPTGGMTVLDGAPVAGEALLLGVDNPLGTQLEGALPFLALASREDPAAPCGTLLSGFGQRGPGAEGELLLDLATASIWSGAPWRGKGRPSPFLLSLPKDPGLVGMELYAQGLLWDTSESAAVRFGLTDGLRLRVGA